MLKAVKLYKTFGTRVLFKNVNFEIYPASIHLLQGNNGVGKSTLFKIITGLLEQSSGTIECELDISQIGYLAHNSFMYPQMTALENIEFWHTLHTKKSAHKDEYMSVLEKFGLSKFAYEKVQIFSRGMVQKLSLARLKMQNPKLYLLDEPSTGLDVSARKMLIDEIIENKRNNASVFWISHNIEYDMQYADFLHILENKTLTSKEIEKGTL